MATWTFLGLGTVDTITVSGNLTASPPAVTFQEGDLLIAIVTYRGDASFTAPTGWEIVDQHSLGNLDDTLPTAIASGFVAYCVAGPGGSLPASSTFTRTGGDVARIVPIAYRSSESGAPTLGQHSMTTAATNGTTSSTTGFTTSGADALLIGAHHGARSVGCSGFKAATDPSTQSGATDITTAPSSTWRERYDAGSANGAGLRVGVFDAVKATVGATGTFTLNSNGDARNVLSATEFNHAVAGGGGAVTGTLAATETGSDTAAFTGGVRSSGALAADESGTDTAAFTGGVRSSGALAATEAGSDTASFTGSFADAPVSGSLAATETGSDTAAFTGDVSNPLTLTVSDGSPNPVSEGEAVGFLLLLSAAAPEDIVVFYELQFGTADSGDVIDWGEGFTIINGPEDRRTVFIDIVADGLPEGAETFSLVVTGAFGANSGTPVTVLDDTGTVTIAESGGAAVSGSLAATETGSDTAAFTGSVAPPAVTGSLAATETGSDTAAFTGSATGGVVETPAQTAGGYEYIAQKRKKQKERFEEREEIRELLRRALSDDTPEAEAVVAVAKPFVERPNPDKSTILVDWTGIETRMAALNAALAAYEAHLHEQAQIAAELEDEDEFILLLAA